MARYIVNGDTNNLNGWTAETLAAALRAPLAALGVTVECRPTEHGLGGLVGCEDDNLDQQVTDTVERIVTA